MSPLIKRRNQDQLAVEIHDFSSVEEPRPQEVASTQEPRESELPWPVIHREEGSAARDFWAELARRNGEDEGAEEEDEAARGVPEEEVAQREEQAYQQGYEQGHEQGQAAALAEAEQILAGISAQAVEQVRQYNAQLREQVRREAVELALIVAERIVERRLQEDADILVEQVDRALQTASLTGEVVLRLNPADAASLRQETPRLLERQVGITRLHTIEDEAVERGSFIIDAGIEGVDGRVARRLQAAREVLLEVLATGDGGEEPIPTEEGR